MGAVTAAGAKATVQGTFETLDPDGKRGCMGGQSCNALGISNTVNWIRQLTVYLLCRFPSQHVRFRRCLGHGQGRSRFVCYS